MTPRKDLKLIKLLMASKLPSEIDINELSKRAILELEGYPDKAYADLKNELLNGLKQRDISPSNATLPNWDLSEV